MRATVIIAGLAAVLAATPALAQQQQPPQDQAKPQAMPNLPADADAVIGKSAMSPEGKELGAVQDVLISQDGRVHAVIIDYDGAQRAIPWDQTAMQGDQLSVKMNEEQMSQLPEYSAQKE